MTDDPKHLLSGYAAEILTDDERRRLMAAALDDQEIFDRLVEEESWRRVLGAPGVRRELLAALDEPGPLAAFFQWLRRPAVTLAAGSVAALVLAVVLLPYWTGSVDPGTGDPTPIGESPGQPVLVSKGLNDLTAKSTATETLTLSYGLELARGEEFSPVGDDHRFASGDRFRVRLETDFEAWVYLFNRSEGEDVYAVVYPLSDREHSSRRGEILLPPGESGWLAMDETPGDEELILVIATDSCPAFATGQESVASAELEPELGRIAAELESVSWHRSVAGDRVHLKVAGSKERLTYVARLLGER